MTAVPRLTIGLAVYNGENYLAESVESLLGQTFEDFELIISDNASTDGSAAICREYAERDSRIRYFRQPHNIGSAPNHNFTIEQARGELFKTAAHDDLYARDLLKRCVDALDAHPEVVLAHSWSAVIDGEGAVTELVAYPVDTSAASAPDRLRSMLFDGWGDDEGGVVRTEVLKRTALHGSYHFADRTFTAEIALHGPFYMVPDYLWFRREHAGQGGVRKSVRARCSNLDPRRANRLRHPVARLYGEYLLSYVSAIRRAPMSAAEQRACYRVLGRWAASRVLPVAGRSLSGSGLRTDDVTVVQQQGQQGGAEQPLVSVDAVVAGRERRQA
jgi:glycosyltransferase involved in cell wall biosynthesis